MNRAEKIKKIRQQLSEGKVSIGSWMQIPHPSIAEIMGAAGYDWVAIDMEHGSIGYHQLPDLFRALEHQNTLPLARLGGGSPLECKQALDAGAGGVIVPMIKSVNELVAVRDACCWPPQGSRGVGFSRANLFGKRFEIYREEAQAPFIVAMIEHVAAVENLDAIIKVDGLDAILIGPYDLSASLGITAEFDNPTFISTMHFIQQTAKVANMPVGVHVVKPLLKEFEDRIAEGYRFIAYSIDAVFLYSSMQNPLNKFIENPVS